MCAHARIGPPYAAILMHPTSAPSRSFLRQTGTCITELQTDEDELLQACAQSVKPCQSNANVDLYTGNRHSGSRAALPAGRGLDARARASGLYEAAARAGAATSPTAYRFAAFMTSSLPPGTRFSMCRWRAPRSLQADNFSIRMLCKAARRTSSAQSLPTRALRTALLRRQAASGPTLLDSLASSCLCSVHVGRRGR